MVGNAFDVNTAVVPHSASGVTRLRRQTTIHLLPVEILTEIFVQCIPPLVPSEPDKFPKFETHPRQIRAILAQVCRMWCTVLYHEPRVWGTLALNYPNPNPEIISLWLKRSKCCLLDVYIDPHEWDTNWDHPALPAISALLYNELTRIRTLFASGPFMDSFSTLPLICGGHTILLRMESLNLLPSDIEIAQEWKARFSFPRLHTLTLRSFEILIDGPMQNLHHLNFTECHGCSSDSGSESEDDIDPNEVCHWWCYRLFQNVPNLVSLKWHVNTTSRRRHPPVVLPFLKFLRLPSYDEYGETLFSLRCFVAPSLENLDIDLRYSSRIEGMLKEALDVICRDESVRLRHLTLRCLPKTVNFRAMSPHLDHLDSLTIYDPTPRRS